MVTADTPDLMVSVVVLLVQVSVVGLRCPVSYGD